MSTPTIIVARYPPHKPPFVDECLGMDQSFCTPNNAKGQCTWSTRLPFAEQYPWCFDYGYAITKPIRTVNVGISTKFFVFNAGVHLSEGTHQKFFYNLTPDECATECLRSAALCTFNVRCLSFDFYPFEQPIMIAPWNEAYEKGVCILNNQNKDSARLRNSDLGWTDAQLFYRSHFSYLPFADTEGYYEVRDSRGFDVGNMLNYANVDSQLPATNNVWGGSRWGIFHYDVPKPPPQVTSCPIPIIGASPPPIPDLPHYFGGYTPVDTEQKCPGLVTFDDAESLCMYSGGRLCLSQELGYLRGVKLGCGFDGPVRGTTTLTEYALWSESDRPQHSGDSKTMKYPRCCANYAELDSCDAYRWDYKYMVNGKCLGDGSRPSNENMPYCPYSQCSQYTKATDCVNFASGSARQREVGMGIFLDQVRQNCTRYPSLCKGMIQDWAGRDSCVWCPTPGVAPGGGAGECRVGSSLAICPGAPQLLRNVWVNTVKSHAGCAPLAETTCRLIQNYPDLQDDLLSQPVATVSPTIPGFVPPLPTCINPPAAPTFSPFTNPYHHPSVSQSPTPSDTTVISQDTSQPTNQPTAIPRIIMPPTTQVTEPCYGLLNTPKECDARPDCIYIASKKLCLRKQRNG